MSYLNGPDISAGHPLPNLTGQSFLFDRACLGTTPDTAFDPHENYSTHLVELEHWPEVVRGSYIFLAGPKRGQLIPLQIGKYAELSAVGMTCLDWETDSYRDRHTGKTVSFGRQPFAQVLVGVDEARLHGMNPGVYCSRFLLTRPVVKALVKKKVAFIWGAAYDGLTLPDFVLNCGLPVFHQYTGTGLDRSRFFGATGDGRPLIDQLRALAGLAPVPVPVPVEAEPMTDLVPLTCHRVVDLPAGTVLTKTPGGETFTTLSQPARLGLLGATATHYHVADGDRGVYVLRTLATVATAEQNVGA